MSDTPVQPTGTPDPNAPVPPSKPALPPGFEPRPASELPPPPEPPRFTPPPTSEPPPTFVPPPPSAPANTTGLEPNVAALLATLFTLVGGCVFIVLEKKDQFVRFWAMQSIFFGGLLLVVSLLLYIVMLIFSIIPFIGWLIGLVLWLAHLALTVAWCIVYVICAFKAFTKEEWEIPWVGKLARQQLARMDAVAPAA